MKISSAPIRAWALGPCAMLALTLLLLLGHGRALAQSGTSIYDAFPIPVSACGQASFYDYQNNGYGFYDSYGSSSPDVWYSFTLSGSSTVNISLCGSNFDTYLHLLDAGGSPITSNDDNGPLCSGTSSSMQASLAAGTYYILAEGYSNYTGEISLAFDSQGTAVPTAGTGTWNAIDAGTFSASGSYSHQLGNSCMPNNMGQASGEVFYRFTLTGTATVNISHCGSNFDTYMHLLDGSGNGIAYNDDSYSGPCPGTQSHISTTLASGTYYVVSEGYGMNTGLITTNMGITMSAGGGAAPSISYAGPVTLTVGTAASLAPVNSGGAVSIGGQVTSTFAGNGSAGAANGTGTGATFNNPISTAVDAAGNVYVADAGNHGIRKISPSGVVVTLAGAGHGGHADGTGSAAMFRHPTYMAVDAAGNVYVSDQQNHRIRKVSPGGVVSTFAGSGYAGFADGMGTSASFQYPMGLVLDGSGNLYVADAYNQRIRKVTPAGVVSTYAGTGSVGSANGAALSSTFQYPMGLALDGAGNLYVADRYNHMVRKITAAGVVSTLAGSGSIGSANGTGSAASFNYANSVAVDGQGNVYVADYLNNMVRMVSPAGVVSTLAGSTTAGTVDGAGSVVRFSSPYGLSHDGHGSLYLAENAGNRIRKITLQQGYGISPALPAGLVFNGATGEISGTPTAISPATTYTVTAYNSSGSSTTSFSLAVAIANCGISFSADQNYVVSYVPREAGLTTAAAVVAASCDPSRVQTGIQYLDGLGRPLQSIQVKGSPGQRDIVQPVGYDAFGREAVKYQPYGATAGSGAHRPAAITDQLSFYTGQASTSSIRATGTPFSVTVFEPSPLNRVLEQGAPGDPWQPVPNSTAGHTVKMTYGTNTGNEVRLWNINGTDNGATSPGNYGAGKLYKTVTMDENWTAGHEHSTEEFKDLEGRVVMKRTWQDNSTSLSTHYIYDDLGNLRYVVPPAVNENGKAGYANTLGFTEGDPVFDHFIYGYRYDGRKRMIKKKVPGKGWEEMVYNTLDQLVLSRDAKQALAGQWSFTKYDALGRAVITGLHNDGRDRDALQGDLGAWEQNHYPIWEQRDNTGATPTSYTNVAFPTSIAHYHTVSLYDDYDFYGNSFGQPNGTTQVTSERTRGLLIGTRVNVLGTGTNLLTVMYYDPEGRVVQSKSQHYLSGTVNASNYDEVNNTYDFPGQLRTSTRVHHTTAGNTTITNTYTYDHMGRRKTNSLGINGQTPVLISNMDYDEIGQLRGKKLHNDMQPTTLTYNERGWLKSSVSGIFNEYLSYQENGSQQYNGNISTQSYVNGGSNVFTYGYDKLNRLISASATGLGENIAYDVMGNITSLYREGHGTNSYNTYEGNKLKAISGFTNSGYTYDNNTGNLVHDSGKGITMSYNHLNLPEQVSGAVSVGYVYDATGGKLRKVTPAGTVNYINGIQYKTDGTIDFIQNGEGIARNNNVGSYSFEYNLTDHLGNVRATFYQNPNPPYGIEVLQRDDYYAFGLRKMGVPNSNNNKYLYNGKELQDELGQYDYGARFYDPVIGRWNVVDPLAEKFFSINPYNFTDNNPVNNIDPNGMETYYGQEAQDVFRQIQGNMSSRQNDDPPGWLQKIMSFFGFGNTQPKDAEEASEQADRRSALFAKNKELDENMETAQGIPVVGGLLSISKGLNGTLTKKGNTMDIVYGSGSVLNDFLGASALKAGGMLFIKGFGNVSKELFHRKFKQEILKLSGDFSKTVGKNPDIIVENGKVILKGVGDFKGKVFNTTVEAAKVFK